MCQVIPSSSPSLEFGLPQLGRVLNFSKSQVSTSKPRKSPALPRTAAAERETQVYITLEQ